MPETRRNLAWDDLGDLGEVLWRAGQTQLALDRIGETISRLEEGGARTTAAGYRIKLCAMLRVLGRTEEAARWLPEEIDLPPHLGRALLAERVEMHLAAGRANEAVAASQTLLELWCAEPVDCLTESAIAEGLLAKALLAAGNFAEAESHAHRAADLLGPLSHVEAAGCLVTLALAHRELTGEWESAMIEEARRLIEGALLLTPAERQRVVESEMGRASGAMVFDAQAAAR
jgi:tetratricopeptide (TPR) repeat protein